jgi:hypothetical protein
LADTTGMSEQPPYILDITDIEDENEHQSSHMSPHRKWIGVRFDCCGVYCRVYRNRQGTAYVGHCPRCNRQVRVRIGPGGINKRFFKAG